MTPVQAVSDPKVLATRYIDAVGQGRLEEVAGMLHPKLEFDGNFGPVPVRGPEGWLGALRRLSPILLRNEIRRVIVEGPEACILYDFVTPVCPVPSAEWLTFEAGRIISIFLLFDRSRWPEVLDELKRRQ
ncbi:MAG TPA: nuclear transport factor 2 family protein [Spirochaetia bacterium]|nr:nuclear transport factor 2 family protein [Spirochaetia bacterium]